MAMVKVVCFDVGGVLIKITQLWHEAAKYAGIDILADLPADAHLLDTPFLEHYQTDALTDDEYIAELAKYLGDIPVESALAVHNHIIIQPYDGVDQVISSLNEKGLLTACLSNTNEPHWQAMHSSGRFPAIEALKLRMASHRLGLHKPDPAIFRKFEEAAEASGGEIVFFDDSLENVRIAKSLGWQAFHVNPLEETSPQIAAALESVGIGTPRPILGSSQ